MRCRGTTTRRPAEMSASTQANRTRAAPSNASSIRNTPAITADFRTIVPFLKNQSARITTRATPRPARKEETLCENSIKVSTVGLEGTNWSPHFGQVSPQPSPDPVALTIVPPRMTRTLKVKVAQAVIANALARTWDTSAMSMRLSGVSQQPTESTEYRTQMAPVCALNSGFSPHRERTSETSQRGELPSGHEDPHLTRSCRRDRWHRVQGTHN